MMTQLEEQVQQLSIRTESLSVSVEHLVMSLEHTAKAQEEASKAQQVTNKKIDDMVQVFTEQLLLSQKVESMDERLKEAFENRDKTRDEMTTTFNSRFEKLESAQNIIGCPSMELKIEKVKTELVEDRNIAIELLDIKSQNRFWKGLTIGYLGLTFAFGYLYLDIGKVYNESHKYALENKDDIIELNLEFSKHIASDMNWKKRSVD